MTKIAEVKDHYNALAADYEKWKKKNAYYHINIEAFVNKIVREGSTVLEVGCATGDLLASTNPSRGVGVDVSEQMIQAAAAKYPDLTFHCSSIEDLSLNETFDYIILVDVVDHVHDVSKVIDMLHGVSHPRTQIILTSVNPWWEPIFNICEKLKLKMPEGPHNFIEKRNLEKIIGFLDFSISYSGYLLLFPKKIPLLSFLMNTLGVKLWLLNKFSLVQYMILQPLDKNTHDLGYGCSIVIPCYNEAGNIEEGVRRIPKMGKLTEIIVVNDGSTDQTADRVRAMQKDYPNLKLIDYSPNVGKGNAVQKGFEAATQDVIMIMDADMTVIPEELPRFFDPLNRGICQFVNGSRMVYPMEDESMRFLNLLGNKVFGLMMTFITGQSLTDTLCGTKAMYKDDFKRIKMGLDKWGDFDLLFGAAKHGLKIMEVAVHYQARRSGLSKMKSFSHGLHLLRACFIGLREIVFQNPEKSN